jgi:hypothetical protein
MEGGKKIYMYVGISAPGVCTRQGDFRTGLRARKDIGDEKLSRAETVLIIMPL